MNGTQGNRTPVKRRLTLKQRKALEKRRRMRKLKKNLKYIIPAAALVIAAIILAIVLAGKGKQDAVAVSSLTEIEPVEIVSITEVQTENEAHNEGSPQMDSLAESVIDAGQVEVVIPDEAVESVEDEAQFEIDNTLIEPEPVSDGPFNYEKAYIRALEGATTGASLNNIDYSVVDTAKRARWPEFNPDALPILVKGENMDENVVCITIDDCFQANNLRQIVQCALDNNGKVTIFPIGDNLEKDAVASVVKWAWENGMEIENHTYNHVGLYHYDDERMTDELWYQSCKLSTVLGVNYRQHFFRPHGGDERRDQRVQAYCAQLGLYGIVHWMQSGSSNSVDSCLENLAPGNIYLYHTTDSDCKKLLQIIPEITKRGYRLVTVNEMFGLPENETSDLSTLDVNAKPEFKPFKVVVPSLKKTTYSRASAVVQQRLIDLGWLDGEADGEFGKNSYIATGFFQVASGIKGSGVADPETQAAMFADNAERATPERLKEMQKQYESYKK